MDVNSIQHDGHGDGSMDMDMGKNCGMSMSLHFRMCEPLLVSTWKTDTTGKFVAALIGFFLLAFAYEALKYFREIIFVNQLKLRNTVSIKTNAEDGTVTRVAPTNREQMLNSVHYGQTFLHGVQVFISYILMLVVMLCNMWLIIAICLGAALGYFIFGWMKKVPCQDSNECCY